MPSDGALLELALALAQEAGELIAARRAEGVEVAATKTTIVDVVTAADREAEQLLRDRLARLRPDDGFYGEESDPTAGGTGLTWVVDPIDGTVNYLYGIPNYAVSIAVVTGDPARDPAEFETIAGVVLAPAAGECYAAVRGGGATLNGAPIGVGDGPAELAQTLLATGYAYEPETRRLQAEIWLALAGVVRDVRRMGAASLDLCGVASGRLDAYFEIGLKPWDWAAGALIAREAGAEVSGWSGEAESRGMLVCGHPRISADLQQMLEAHVPSGLRNPGPTSGS
ncbi:MAG: inositol monophosphatase [Microbacteriaceae bacterium]|nr:inositol monophosphatase [Microbacteriaceae bacterium]